MFNLYGKSDSSLCREVRDQLSLTPSLYGQAFEVEVHEGIVTLRGRVKHYMQKGTAESVAESVRGVRAIVDELTIYSSTSEEVADTDLARAALTVLQWNCEIPQGLLLAVDSGWITISGDTKTEYERKAAQSAVSALRGVKGVWNDIVVS